MRILKSLIILFILHAVSLSQLVVGQFRYAVPGPLEITQIASGRDGQGNIYVMGTAGTTPYAWGHLCITEKFTANGSLVWTDIFSDSTRAVLPSKLLVKVNGEAIVVGDLDAAGTESHALFIRHLSPSGQLLRTITDPSLVTPRAVFTNPEGHIILVSDGSPDLVGSQMAISGFDLSSSIRLFRQAIGFSPNWIDFAGDSMGNAFIFLTGSEGYVLYKIDESTGHFLWSRSNPVQSARPTYPLYSQMLANGDIAISGLVQRPVMPQSPKFVQASLATLRGSDGAIVSERLVGAANEGVVNELMGPPQTDEFGNTYFAIRQSNVDGTNPKAFVGRVASNGTVAWQKDLPAKTREVNLGVGASGLWVSSSDRKTSREFRYLDLSGRQMWGVVAGRTLASVGGDFFVDSQDSLTYTNQSQTQSLENSFGFVKLSAVQRKVTADFTQRPNGTVDNSFQLLAFDSAGNSFVSGLDNYSPFVEKLGPTGAKIWKRMLAPGQRSFAGAEVKCVDYLAHVGLVVGVSGPGGGFAVHLGVDGQVRWITNLVVGSPADNIPKSIKLDGAGNVTALTNVAIKPYPDTNILRLRAADGTLQWRRKFGIHTVFGDISADPAGNVFAVGFKEFGVGDYLVKLNSVGGTLFSKEAPIAGAFTAWGAGFSCQIVRDPQSGDYLVMSTASPAPYHLGGGYQIARYSANGISLWHHEALPFNDYKTINVGLTYDPVLKTLAIRGEGLSVGQGDSLVSKMDPLTGETKWTRMFDIPSNMEVSAKIEFDKSGNVLFAGCVTDNIYGRSGALPYFRKLDGSTGEVLASTTVAGSFDPYHTTIQGLSAPPDGKPLLFGRTRTESNVGGSNAYMVKYAFAPRSRNDAYTVGKNGSLPVAAASVLANDEWDQGSVAQVVSPPKHAKTFSLSSTGKITYQPATDFVGSDVFSYRIKGTGGMGNIAVVTVTVSP